MTPLESEMDRFVVLVFGDAQALVVDAEPLICDGCVDELEVENWAVAKFAAGRDVFNVVIKESMGAARAYISTYGYAEVRD